MDDDPSVHALAAGSLLPASATDELRAERELIHALVEHVEAAVVLLDRDGAIRRSNPAAERLAGHSALHLSGRRFAEHFAAAGDRAHVEALVRAASAGRSGCETRVGVGGDVRTIGWEFVGLRADEPARGGVLAVGHDRGARPATTDDAPALEGDVRHAQRMDTIGRLAGNVAHDFHNVLTAVLGFADVLMADLADRPEARAMAAEIRGAAEQAVMLTGQLKALSAKRDVAPRPVDPREELLGMRDLLARAIGEDVVLDLELDSGDATVLCDPGEFTQMMLNLALNGRDAMPRGGRLTIASALVVLAPAEAARRGLAERSLLLTVRDTGCGMDEATRRRVFEPYFTTKGEAGTGIGLANVHQVVRASGGTVEVESAVGQGTRFLLWFPCATTPTCEPLLPYPASAEPLARGTILLVEDEPAVRRLMRETLKRQGWQVLEAGDGREALACAGAFAGGIDVLVTDVVMPGMSGGELAQRLTSEGRLSRVLFVSGYPDEAMRRHGVSVPAEVFLAKPFPPATLARRVRELVAEAPTG